MHEEIELKLELPPEALPRLRRHRLIRETRQGRGSTRRLVSIYYDTPDRALAHEGMGLRLRHEGRLWIQTLKTRGTPGAGHFTRYEWDTPLRAPVLNLPALADTPAAAVLAQPEIAASLAPLFATRFQRTTWNLAGGGAEDPWAVALTLDHGAITLGAEEPAEGQGVPLCELELELIAGEPRHLYALARTLAEGVPMVLTVASKAERGYALAANQTPCPVKAGVPGLKPTMTVAEAVRQIGHACLHHLAANQRVLLLTRDAEAVHQMRVALRRLRSMLTLFKGVTGTGEGAAISEELRWLTGELGDARDLDVFLDEVVAPVAEALPDTPGLVPLMDSFADRRDEAYARALEAAGSPRCTALALDTARWLEGGDWLSPAGVEGRAALAQPIRAFAAHLLSRRRGKVRKVGEGFSRLDPVARHQLRIQIKKLRYAADFFSALFPAKRVKAYAETLALLQEHLGALNDGVVAHRLLHAAALPSGQPADGEPDAVTDPESVFAAGLIAGWQERQAADHREAAAKAWKGFLRAKPFWD